MGSALPLIVVHRDPKLRELVAAACESSGLCAHTFAIASTALALAIDLRPRCVVSELQPPEMDAERLLRELRGHQRLLTPFLVLGPANAGARIRAVLDAGADGYMVEPFPVHELLGKIRSLLQSAEPGPAAGSGRRPPTPSDGPPVVAPAVVAGNGNDGSAAGAGGQNGSGLRPPEGTRQVDQQHESALALIDHLVVEARRRRAIWPRTETARAASGAGGRG